MNRFLAWLLFAGCAMSASVPRTAQACSGGPMGETLVLPPDGSTEVSTATSIVVVAGLQAPEISVLAGGSPVELGPATRVGTVLPGGGNAWRLALPDFLNPMTTYEVIGPAQWSSYTSSSDGGDAPVLLSRFTTAAGYDKAEGKPPKITSLRLWRLRFPKAEIGAGRCVFSEYHGFVEIDIEPATVPHTTPDGTLYTLTLQPETGGAQQSISFTGNEPFRGRDPTSDPFPRFGSDWVLELDPTRRYCATLIGTGDGDLAREELRSASTCADVEVHCLPGSESNAGPDDTCAAAESTGCGCRTPGDRPVRGAPWAAFVLAALALYRRKRRANAGPSPSTSGQANPASYAATLSLSKSSKAASASRTAPLSQARP